MFVNTCVKAATSTEKEKQLQAELDKMSQDKDRQISSLKEELQAKQREITSLIDQLKQKEKEMRKQKGKRNEHTLH